MAFYSLIVSRDTAVPCPYWVSSEAETWVHYIIARSKLLCIFDFEGSPHLRIYAETGFLNQTSSFQGHGTAVSLQKPGFFGVRNYCYQFMLVIIFNL